MFKFMFGADLADALRSFLFRVLPCWQDEGEDESLASADSRELSEKGLQGSMMQDVQVSNLQEV